MVSLIIAAYAISAILHLIAIIIGVACIYAGDDIFKNSKPSNIFVSRTEQKYWTVCFGTSGNIFLLYCLVVYTINYDDMGVGSLDIPFTVGHILCVIPAIIWHSITYRDIKSGVLK